MTKTITVQNEAPGTMAADQAHRNAKEALAAGWIYVRCASGRARRTLIGGTGAQCFYSANRNLRHGCYRLPASDIDRVRAIRGVTVMRGWFEDLGRCWT